MTGPWTGRLPPEGSIDRDEAADPRTQRGWRSARVAAAADPGQVLVSSTVKDLVVGSGLGFGDRGPQTLKEVPGEWRLFLVEEARAA